MVLVMAPGLRHLPLGRLPAVALSLGLGMQAACGERQAPVVSVPSAVASAAAALPASAPDLASAAAPVAKVLRRSGQADRVAPPTVAPVEREGVRYAQSTDGRSLGWKQVGGVLEATQVASGKRLWSLPVYTREVDPKLEADVQWVFFKTMRFLPSGELLIENESGEQYLVDVQKQTSTRKPSTHKPSP